MDQQFFSLTRSGLWNTPADVSLFRSVSPSGWETLYRMALKQALIAITFDGIATLPAALRPPNELYLKWAARTIQIEENNKRHNEIISRLQALYTAAGLHPVLLKGQGLACNYFHPMHRQCGDIDVYLGKKGQPIANRILQNKGAGKSSEATDKHAGYLFNGVPIENHRIIIQLGNPFSSFRFSRMVKKWYPQEAESLFFKAKSISGTALPDMPLPPPTFNALYVFLHAFEHFLTAGIGLRQLCDWTCLIARYHQVIDAPVLLKALKDFGMLSAAGAFGYVAVKQLGLQADFLPFSIENAQKLGEKLLEEILMTGNFGQHDTRIAPRGKNYWGGKWHTFRNTLVRSRMLLPFAPVEVFCFPLVLIKSMLSLQLFK